MYKKIIRGLKKGFMPALFLIAGLIIWEVVILLFKLPEYILPTPRAIIVDIFSNFSSLISHLWITIIEAVGGLVIASILGIVIATIFLYSRNTEKGFYPYIIALKTTPIIVLAPLLVLWFGNGILSKIVIVVLICFFPIVVNTLKGFKSVNQDYLDLFRSLNSSKKQIFMKLRFPFALPYIFSALKISSSLAFVGAIVGEFVGANEGIGFVILVASYHLNTVRMFSGIILVALAGIILFFLIDFIEKKVVYWKH
jgi:NitT/TauT family transport system permease protein